MCTGYQEAVLETILIKKTFLLIKIIYTYIQKYLSELLYFIVIDIKLNLDIDILTLSFYQCHFHNFLIGEMVTKTNNGVIRTRLIARQLDTSWRGNYSPPPPRHPPRPPPSSS